METALTIFSQVLTMFLLIGVGFGCCKFGIFSTKTNQELSNFLLTVVSSALILNTYQSDSSPETIKNLGLSFLLSAGIFILSTAVSYLMKIKPAQPGAIATERFGVVYPNSAYMGIPLLLASIGDVGVLYASAFIVVSTLYMWLQGVALFTGKWDKKLLVSVVKNPVVICIVLGLPLFLFQVKFPAPIASAVSGLASLMTPLSMLIAGMFIAQSNLLRALSSLRVYAVVFLRLIFIPMVMLFILKFLPIDQDLRLTFLILSAAPCATVSMSFADRFGGHVERASSMFAVSTLLCIFTIPLMILCAEWIW